MATALVVAFAAGFVARWVGLPALVGYLLAGFALHAAGFEPDPTLDLAADIGVLLLLFGIGLKLQLKTLARPMVWGTEVVFATVGVLVVTGTLVGLGALGLDLAGELTLRGAAIVGLALSFSSTVFTVQALAKRQEAGSLQGRIAISILVLQDLIAVGFLVVADGAVPSVWAIPLIAGLVLARRPVAWLLDRSGHGEVFVLLGFALAVGIGAGSFALVDLKPDLGALAAGMLLAGHPRAGELSDRLLGFKDLLLVGFFLSIGLAGSPSAEAWVVGVAAVALIPTRSAVMYLMLTRFGLRSRTSFHASLSLSTYSEFGLIAVAAATANGLLDPEWVSIVGVAVAVSLAVDAAATTGRYWLYARAGARLHSFERAVPVADDAIIDIGEAQIVVFGMGRIGTGAYDRFDERLDWAIVGIDRSESVVDGHHEEGRRVVRGDALDREFWERVRFHPDVELVVAAMNSHRANLECVARVKEFLSNAKIASIAMYPDQVTQLREAGVHIARNLYEEAGQGLADDSTTVLMGDDPASA